eukprot:1156531-Pelagomonas_calceolata.AAC.8
MTTSGKVNKVGRRIISRVNREKEISKASHVLLSVCALLCSKVALAVCVSCAGAPSQHSSIYTQGPHWQAFTGAMPPPRMPSFFPHAGQPSSGPLLESHHQGILWKLTLACIHEP